MNPRTRCFSSSLICSCASSIGGKFDAHFGDFRRQRQSDLWDDYVFSRVQHTRGTLCREALRRNRKLKRPWSDVGEGILPIISRLGFLAWGLVLPGELYPGAGNGGSVRIDNRSVDAPGHRRIGRLCARGGLRRLGIERAGRKAEQTELAEAGTRGPSKNCGKFRREISCRGRFLWKSQLLFYSLPADFQQVFAVTRRSRQGPSRMG